MSLFPDNCSFCGHRWPHPQPCPGTITVRRGRPPVEQQVPCECQRHTFGKPVDTASKRVAYAREMLGCNTAAPAALDTQQGPDHTSTTEES